jgi:hypothetical protein
MKRIIGTSLMALALLALCAGTSLAQKGPRGKRGPSDACKTARKAAAKACPATKDARDAMKAACSGVRDCHKACKSSKGGQECHQGCKGKASDDCQSARKAIREAMGGCSKEVKESVRKACGKRGKPGKGVRPGGKRGKPGKGVRPGGKRGRPGKKGVRRGGRKGR